MFEATQFTGFEYCVFLCESNSTVNSSKLKFLIKFSPGRAGRRGSSGNLGLFGLTSISTNVFGAFGSSFFAPRRDLTVTAPVASAPPVTAIFIALVFAFLKNSLLSKGVDEELSLAFSIIKLY